MTYLPREIPNAKVLITVKTYPQPSDFHGEIVCTAGLLENGKWVRVYPIRYRVLPNLNLRKYSWIKLDLVKITSDKRPETYRPKIDIEQNLKVIEWVDTSNNWEFRKSIVLKEVFYSFDELIKLSKSEVKKSLATIKPKEIIDFKILKTDREWKSNWQAQWGQLDIFEQIAVNSIIRKVPYKFYYEFVTEDNIKRKIEIEDWEIGALYWNCLKSTDDNEKEALELLRKKYFDDFVYNKDLYFFVGTNYLWHVKNSPNPFMIIGLFYPPKSKNEQLSLTYE
ncbi:MAG: hypothetical protein KAW88_00520 [Candidatus Cloacimonetes bacterium]|nr:hypothetical protein [Candidatus Cloacimonadota bacterium]